MSFQKFFTGKEVASFEEAIKKIGLPKSTRFVKMEQVHGVGIAEVNTNGAKSSDLTFFVPKVDATYTSEKNLFLSVKSADCLPILIYGDGFVAAAHAGRKGTSQKILTLLLNELNQKYRLIHILQTGLIPLQVWFGPCICKNCYQIDRTTDTHYDLITENMAQIFDFFATNGLDPKKTLRLEVENHCTLHEPKRYYSYRATGPGVKMNYSFIGII
ncbi:MAG: laccase domain protein [Patescibacteria group bacterium]|nr:MAG: laccase domain protein [Patescibacteria group bacterium]